MAITPDDVAVSLGRSAFSSAEEAQVQQWIDDARLLIRVRLGDLDELDQDVLDFVTREAVAARSRNPEGYQSETIDDYTYRHGTATRQVTILDEWWLLLDPDVSTASFSTRPTFEPDTAQWSVGDPFPVEPGWPNL